MNSARPGDTRPHSQRVTPSFDNPSYRSQPSAIVTLPNGHDIAYEEYGCSEGRPFFYFHDCGSSRLEAAFHHAAAKECGYRLIALDRPGIGWSAYYANATASDIADDVIQLANCLRIEQFGVLALGSGGIFALTVAHRYPDRIRQFISLAGVPGTVFSESCGGSEWSRALSRVVPALVKVLVRCRFGLLPESPSKSLGRLFSELSLADRKVLSAPLVRNTLALDQQEMLRQGSRGLAQDMANCFRKLNFSLAEVSVPTTIWQGRADSLSLRADCEFLASHLQSANFHRVSNGGHFFFIHSMGDVFSRLRGHSSLATPLAA